MDRWARARYRPKTWSERDGKYPGPRSARASISMEIQNRGNCHGLIKTKYRYIQKFHQMRTQLQAVSLRIQTVRSNEQMMQSMKGATSLLGSMNRSMNLPALQRIAMEFEKENDIMDQRQEMMDDAIDDVTGLEDEEEGEEVVKEVLDEIGVDLGQAVSLLSMAFLPCFCGERTALASTGDTLADSMIFNVSRMSMLTPATAWGNAIRSAANCSHGCSSRRSSWWRRRRRRRRGRWRTYEWR